MRLMVCPRTSVTNYLEAPVTHFVSLVDPDDADTIVQPRATRSQLQLIFSDLDDIEMTLPRFAKYSGPQESHVAAMIKLGESLASLDDWGLLTHCEAGISRSTAAAITIVTAAGYRPQTAFGIVRKVCPEMLPNRRMLRLTDNMLNTGGILFNMAEIHRRKAFLRAGYEDPTNVLLRESQAQAEASPARKLLRRFLDALPKGWRVLVGSGTKKRAVTLQRNDAQAPPSEMRAR